jgi:hypothetical protein
VIADLSRIVEDSMVRLDQMSHQEISDTFLGMGAITRRFLAAVNYRGNLTLPLFPRYPPVVLQHRLNWSFRRGTIILVTATLPASFLPGAPSGTSSL